MAETKISTKTRERIHRLLDSAIDRTEKGNDTTFEYHGHAQQVDIRMYRGKWKPESKFIGITAYLDFEDFEEIMSEMEVVLND